MKLGHYIINPDIEVRNKDGWIKLYYLFPLEVAEDEIVLDSSHEAFVNLVKSRRVTDSMAVTSAQLGEAKDKLLKTMESFVSVLQEKMDN